MSLQDRLESKAAQRREEQLAAEAEENEKKLTPVLDDIQRKEQEKSELERLGAELDSAYKAADQVLASFKGKKKILQQLLDTYREELQDEGIATRTDVLEAPDYKNEYEVKEYKTEARALRDTVTKIVGLRAEIREAFPDSGLVLTSGKREEGQNAIQGRVGELEAEIAALTEQTPEGQAAKRERIKKELCESPGRSVKNRPEIFSQDIEVINQYDESFVLDSLKEYYLRPTEEQIDKEKKSVRYEIWEKIRDIDQKKQENRELINALRESVIDLESRFVAYVGDDDEKKTAMAQWSRKLAAAPHLAEFINPRIGYRSNKRETSSVDGFPENQSDGVYSYVNERGNDFYEYDQEEIAGMLKKAQRWVDSFKDDKEFKRILIMPGESDDQIQKETFSMERIYPIFLKELGPDSESIGKVRNMSKRSELDEYLIAFYSKKEQEWKSLREENIARVEAQLEQSLVDYRVREMGNEPAILKTRIENMRRIEDLNTLIQGRLNALTERSAESLTFSDVPEEFGWSDGDKQNIADHEAAIGDKAAGTGLWGAAAKKEKGWLKGELMGLGKNLAGAQSDREEIDRRQAIIDRTKAEKQKVRNDAVKKERSRVETLTKSITEITKLISDTVDYAGSAARTLTIEAQRIGTVGGAVTLLESKIKDILDEKPTTEELETLAIYNALLDRRKTADEKLQQLPQPTR